MAKSLRSKIKRERRAEKRVRYGAKENKRLEKIINNRELREASTETTVTKCKF